MPKAKAKKSNKQSKHPAQTPVGFIVTGVVLWVVGYSLLVLAIDSGSLIQWAGVLIAFIWGGVRIAQGVAHLIFKF